MIKFTKIFIVVCGLLSLTASGFAGEIRKETYPNGQVKSEITYEGEIKEGSFVTYYEDGKIKAKGTYHVNALEGNFEKFDAKGNLMAVTEYKNGQQDGMLKVYFPGGENKISAEWPYKAGKPYGVWKNYYQSGKLSGELVYGDNGMLNGLSREYYENGNVKLESTFKDNVLVHKKELDEAGNVISDRDVTEEDRKKAAAEYNQTMIQQIKEGKLHLKDKQAEEKVKSGQYQAP